MMRLINHLQLMHPLLLPFWEEVVCGLYLHSPLRPQVMVLSLLRVSSDTHTYIVLAKCTGFNVNHSLQLRGKISLAVMMCDKPKGKFRIKKYKIHIVLILNAQFIKYYEQRKHVRH